MFTKSVPTFVAFLFLDGLVSSPVILSFGFIDASFSFFKQHQLHISSLPAIAYPCSLEVAVTTRMVRYWSLVAALAAVLPVAVADNIKCDANSHCPEEFPCCSRESLFPPLSHDDGLLTDHLNNL